jgi:hypothetical protein
MKPNRLSPCLLFVLAASAALGQTDFEPPGGAGVDMSSGRDRETQWEPLMKRAGTPHRARVLVARPLRNQFEAGQPIDFILSMQNVSNMEAFGETVNGDVPLVLIRDESGHPVRRTEEGNRRYGRGWSVIYIAGSELIWSLQPGQAQGKSFSVSRYYVINKPGRYTALFAEAASGGGCVSRPLTFLVVASGTPKPRGNQNGPGEKEQTVGFGPSRPNDKDWSALAALAGKPLEGLALDAFRSPVSTDRFIVSLRRSYNDEREQVPVPMAGLNSGNYWLLVRGPSGQPLPMLRPALEPDIRPGACDSLDARNRSLFRGDAIGAAIPITRWFDMKEPGEYTILVALPSSERKAPAWVAPPVKFRVGDAKEPRKKNFEASNGTPARKDATNK